MYLLRSLFAVCFLFLLPFCLDAQVGKVGINTTTPAAMLHVKDSSVVFTGSPDLPAEPGPPPVSNEGIRMMWYPDKAAFRAGRVTGNAWNRANVGNHSAAFGLDNIVSGQNAFAAGALNMASGAGSLAFGNNTSAMRSNACALGSSTLAGGAHSFSAGLWTKADAQNSFALGRYNVGGGTWYDWIDTEPLFEIGMGTDNDHRANAMTIYKNGGALWGGQYQASNPDDPPASGPGTRMMWYPDKASLRCGYVEGTAWDKINIGDFSWATGLNTKAKGQASTAIGSATQAIGVASAAMGIESTATGPSSFSSGESTNAVGASSAAMGYATQALGPYAFTMGYGAIGSGNVSASIGSYTLAEANNGFAIGRYNAGGGDPVNWVDTDPVFEIGIGTSVSARANAMTIFKNAGALWGGEYQESNPDAPPATGAGTRMMWYPAKAALRAGHVASTQWNKDSIGNFSIALGVNTKAKGEEAVALGSGTTASGSGATSMGYNSVASGNNSTSMNYATVASGYHATAMGYLSKAQSMTSVAMGRFNIGGGNATSWVSTDPIFEIGIGAAINDLKNAVTVLKNGRVGIGPSVPNASLHVLGEARFESASGGSKIIIDGSTGLTQVEFQDDGIYGAGIGYSIDNSRIFLYHGGSNVFVKNGNLGVGIEPTHKIHVTGGAYCDGGAWVNGSSRNLKENFLRVDRQDVLAKLSLLPVTEWNYISEGQHIRHIGPMAEDFHAAFGLGYDNASISTVDLAGVTVAAVQALREENERLSESNETLRSTCAKLETQQTELEAQVARLTRIVEGMADGTGGLLNPR